MTKALFLSLVEKAMCAPSVHNVQPARWRVENDSILLLEDATRRLSVGDPQAHDAAISLGAALEGLRLAASMHGLTMTTEQGDTPTVSEPYRFVVRCHFADGGKADPLASMVEKRASYRGEFAAPRAKDRNVAAALSAPDAIVITDTDALGKLAPQYDAASYGFMQRRDFRQELLSWMRLSRRHPNWASDGLNADAMAMGRMEALGASWVLGPLFTTLDRLSLASHLLAEGQKIANAAAVVLFHRPEDEDPLDSGAAFYRLWLRIEQAGFGAAVLAALADNKDTAAELGRVYAIPSGQRLVSAFRIGRRGRQPLVSRARLPLNSVLV